ncbi:helix-turn-helix domain-containing protein [Saccharopolyspora sp. NPDC002376]
MEFEHRPSDSPYIERVWSSSGAVARMHSIAYANWELVTWEDQGRVHVAVRGPETSPSTVEVGAESASFGIVFAHGASMPHLPVSQLVDTGVLSSHVTSKDFAMRNEVWELPTFDTAEDFVNRLVRSGVLVRDPLVSDVLAGDEAAGLSPRSVQRRVVTATGLTQGKIRQIERARQAAVLLGEGVSALDVVHQLGYYDQPHMARSLTRFLGRTATELQQPDESEPLSLLYKIGD